jgi:hypothetical protein
MVSVDVPDRVEVAEVDDDATSHGASSHSTPRSARDERLASIGRPPHELRYVIGVHWNGDAIG